MHIVMHFSPVTHDDPTQRMSDFRLQTRKAVKTVKGSNNVRIQKAVTFRQSKQRVKTDKQMRTEENKSQEKGITLTSSTLYKNT